MSKYDRYECIASRNFAALILDAEYPEEYNLPACVFCRVLYDGYFAGRIAAGSREEAINKFQRGEY